MNKPIYLDAAATDGYKDSDDVVVDTIANAMKNYWRNPSSLYASDVKETVDKCRANIASFINADSDEIIFTSGASESNNMAIRGFVDNVWTSRYKTTIVISTKIEHKSIIETIKSKSLVSYVRYCDTDKFGSVDYNKLENMLSEHVGQPILVSIGMANNEIGTIQDILNISNLVHRYNGVLHVDATQAFGHIPINVKEFGIDMMSASGHKISPVLKGIGFLYKKRDINIKPLIYGSQENGLRGGTENTFGIIGLSKAVELCDISKENVNEMCKKRDYFIRLLKSKFGCKLNGCNNSRLPNNINVTFKQNITGESLLYTLDMSGIAIGVGSACNSHSIEPSYVLKAIGLSDEDAMRTIRISLPNDITYENIDYAIDDIDKSIKLIEI